MEDLMHALMRKNDELEKIVQTLSMVILFGGFVLLGLVILLLILWAIYIHY